MGKNGYIRRNRKILFGGGMADLGISFIAGAIGNEKAAKEAGIRQNEINLKKMLGDVVARQNMSDAALNLFPSKGIEDANYYIAKGGKMNNRKCLFGGGEKDLTYEQFLHLPVDGNLGKGNPIHTKLGNLLFGIGEFRNPPKPTYKSTDIEILKNITPNYLGYPFDNTNLKRKYLNRLIQERAGNPAMNRAHKNFPENAKAVGGKKTLLGGGTEEIRPGIEKVYGERHEGPNEGVHYDDKNIVEANEVIYNDNVYTDRITDSLGETFAEKAIEVATSPAQARSTKRNKNEKTPMDMLYAKQEQTKEMRGMPAEFDDAELCKGGKIKKDIGGLLGRDENFNFMVEPPTADIEDFSYGKAITGQRFGDSANFPGETKDRTKLLDLINIGKAGRKALGTSSQYLDNIRNKNLIGQQPQVPVPSLVNYPQLDTDYSIEAALSEGRGALKDFYKSIDQGSAQSSTGRSNKVQGFIKSIEGRNKLFEGKENKETELRNLQALTNLKVDSANTGVMNKYKADEMMRESEILGMKSANIADATRDLTNQFAEANERDLDREKIMINALKYGETGVVDKLLSSETMQAAVRNATPEQKRQIREAIKNRPDALKWFDENIKM